MSGSSSPPRFPQAGEPIRSLPKSKPASALALFILKSCDYQQSPLIGREGTIWGRPYLAERRTPDDGAASRLILEV
jgi:hypothetical protein